MEIEGKIILDLPMQSGTSKAGNPWQKKEWVLETLNTQYPKRVKFTVFGADRCASLQFEVGKNYAISVDVESREYQGRWYTDVNCYAKRDLDSPDAGMAAPQPAYGQPAFAESAATPQVPMNEGNENDDLPF